MKHFNWSSDQLVQVSLFEEEEVKIEKKQNKATKHEVE